MKLFNIYYSPDYPPEGDGENLPKGGSISAADLEAINARELAKELVKDVNDHVDELVAHGNNDTAINNQVPVIVEPGPVLTRNSREEPPVANARYRKSKNSRRRSDSTASANPATSNRSGRGDSPGAKDTSKVPVMRETGVEKKLTNYEVSNVEIGGNDNYDNFHAYHSLSFEVSGIDGKIVVPVDLRVLSSEVTNNERIRVSLFNAIRGSKKLSSLKMKDCVNITKSILFSDSITPNILTPKFNKRSSEYKFKEESDKELKTRLEKEGIDTDFDKNKANSMHTVITSHLKAGVDYEGLDEAIDKVGVEIFWDVNLQTHEEGVYMYDEKEVTSKLNPVYDNGVTEFYELDIPYKEIKTKSMSGETEEEHQEANGLRIIITPSEIQEIKGMIESRNQGGPNVNYYTDVQPKMTHMMKSIFSQVDIIIQNIAEKELREEYTNEYKKTQLRRNMLKTITSLIAKEVKLPELPKGIKSYYKQEDYQAIIGVKPKDIKLPDVSEPKLDASNKVPEKESLELDHDNTTKAKTSSLPEPPYEPTENDGKEITPFNTTESTQDRARRLSAAYRNSSETSKLDQNNETEKSTNKTSPGLFPGIAPNTYMNTPQDAIISEEVIDKNMSVFSPDEITEIEGRDEFTEIESRFNNVDKSREEIAEVLNRDEKLKYLDLERVFKVKLNTFNALMKEARSINLLIPFKNKDKKKELSNNLIYAEKELKAAHRDLHLANVELRKAESVEGSTDDPDTLNANNNFINRSLDLITGVESSKSILDNIPSIGYITTTLKNMSKLGKLPESDSNLTVRGKLEKELAESPFLKLKPEEKMIAMMEARIAESKDDLRKANRSNRILGLAVVSAFTVIAAKVGYDYLLGDSMTSSDTSTAKATLEVDNSEQWNNQNGRIMNETIDTEVSSTVLTPENIAEQQTEGYINNSINSSNIEQSSATHYTYPSEVNQAPLVDQLQTNPVNAADMSSGNVRTGDVSDLRDLNPLSQEVITGASEVMNILSPTELLEIDNVIEKISNLDKIVLEKGEGQTQALERYLTSELSSSNLSDSLKQTRLTKDDWREVYEAGMRGIDGNPSVLSPNNGFRDPSTLSWDSKNWIFDLNSPNFDSDKCMSKLKEILIERSK